MFQPSRPRPVASSPRVASPRVRWPAFKDRLKADDGTTGRAVGVCIITDLRRKEAFCHAVAVFPEGRLFFEWLNRESSKRQTVAVVGGTGAYDDARGSAVAQEARRKTNITVTSSARATTDVQNSVGAARLGRVEGEAERFECCRRLLAQPAVAADDGDCA